MRTSFTNKGLVSAAARLGVDDSDNVPNANLAVACTDIAEALRTTYGWRHTRKDWVEQDGASSYASLVLTWTTARSEVQLSCHYGLSRPTGSALLTFQYEPYSREQDKRLGIAQPR